MDLSKITKEEFFEGVVISIDKPLYWTSFDIVNKLSFTLKHKCKIKKIKIGHAGTLDPLASGLLIICIGKKTKSIESYQAMEKEYSGTFYVGATTPSFDLETDIDNHYSTGHISQEMIQNVAKGFLGESNQLPPAFSAKKIDGKRAYELARKGKTPDVKHKPIIISEFNIEKIQMPDVYFRVVCSKGTYIRSLARDFGLELKSGAYLKTLRRERIGSIHVKDAITIDDFTKLLSINQNFI